MIRIVIIDDHAIVRAGVCALVELEDEFKVVGEAATGEQAISMVQELKPNVAVVDMAMPDMPGTEILRKIHETVPETSCLVLSMQADESYVQEAFKNGAVGYLLKESTTDYLVKGIKRVAEHKRFLGPILIDRAIDAYLAGSDIGTSGSRTDFKSSRSTLTQRESEIVALITEGLTSVAIGNRLGISVRTVDTHRANIMNKLGVRTQAELVRNAIASGIIKE
jgi:DNA-binding NarL/FixJ family response regulator